MYKGDFLMVCDSEIKNFFKVLNSLEDEAYFKFIISYLTAPTLFSSKPATILCFNRVQRNLYELWSRYGYMVREWYRVEYMILKEDKDVKVVMFYNEQNLKNILKKEENKNYLNKLGYEANGSFEDYLNEIKRRFQKMCPHEIGIFLGIPLEDTKQFIEKKGKGFKYCGYWKVYDNLDEAISIFKSFDAARLKIVNEASKKLIHIQI
jgi:hypothetical protein